MMCVCRKTRQFFKISSLETQLFVKRHAGHSKWQNIRHIKEANDAAKQRTFTRIIRMMKVAIQEGKSADPEANSRLASLIGQARQANMPQTTITNAIKAAASSKDSEGTIQMLAIRGPGRSSFLVEAVTNHQQLFKNTLASQMKKLGFRYENAALHDFSEKGCIVAEPLKEAKNPLEEAVEHAILIGIEDVSQDAETRKLKFQCSPEFTFKAKKGLESFGYVVEAAFTEFTTVTKASLTDEDVETCSKFLTKIEVMPEIVRIVDNIE